MKLLGSSLVKNRSGVYVIINTITGMRYIGSSCNLILRIRTHRRKLHIGTHENPYFQNHWNMYGADSFVVEILEYCSISELLVRELHYVDHFRTRDKKHGYNLRIPGEHGRPSSTRKGVPMSDEQKKKISLALQGRVYAPDVYARGALTRKDRGHVPNKGKTLSVEWRQALSKSKKGVKKPNGFGSKISQALRGRTFSKEHKKAISLAKLGVASPNKGKTMSKEQRARISLARTGKKWIVNLLTKETKMVSAPDLESHLNAGWSVCTKRLYRSLN